MKRLFAALFIAAVLTGCCACGENYEYEYFEKDDVVFSGTMPIYVKLLGRESPDAYSEMVSFLDRLGSEITLTDENSALSKFNETAEAGEKVGISEHTYKLISLALEYERETQGAFSVGVRDLSKLWGVDAEGIAGGEKSGELPDYETAVAAAKQNCDTGALTLTESENGYFLEKSNAGLKIDLGGIAKGYCADVCAEIMKAHDIKSGLVNISGNIVLFGKFYDGHKFTDWEIAVTDPRPKDAVLREQVCVIKSGGDVSVVTSGDYRRYVKHESGLELCHIIDPISGLPCDIEYDSGYKRKSEVVSSATVICSSSARADAYSTAFAVMGIDGAADFLKDRIGVDALIFSEKYDGEAETHGRVASTSGINFILSDAYGGYKRYEPTAIL